MAIETKTVGAALPTANVEDVTVLAPDLVPADDSLVRGRIIMDYGDSGDGKSTRAHSFARYYYAKTGKPVLLVSAEDSSKLVFQDLIDAGIVQAVFLTSSKTSIATYERIVEGELLLVGETEPIMRKIAGKEEVVGHKQKWRKIGSEEFSAAIFEGLSTISENILDYLRENGRFPREQSDGFQEGGRTFMAASQTAFGFTQSEGIKLLKLSGALPVERVLWTAHEAKGKDEFGGGVVRGPKLVGSAATNVVRKLVGVLLHTDRVKGEIRCYFTNHPDQTNAAIEWKSKITISPVVADAFKKKYPQGYFVPSLPTGSYVGSQDGLIPFLQFEEEVRSKSSDAASQLAAQHKTKQESNK